MALSKTYDRREILKSGDYGYESFRIPAIAPQLALGGTRIVLACEARCGGSDWGGNDILCGQISVANAIKEDGVFDWLWTLAPPPGHPQNNAAFLKRQHKPRQIGLNNPVFSCHRLFYCCEYSTLWSARTVSDAPGYVGAPQKPILEHLFLDPVSAIGPGHSDVMDGKVRIMPMWKSTGEKRFGHHPSTIGLLLHETHCDRDSSIHELEVPTPGLKNPSECALVWPKGSEVGRLYIREERKKRKHFVEIMGSPATGFVFSEPKPTEIPEPVSMAGAIAHPVNPSHTLICCNDNKKRVGLTLYQIDEHGTILDACQIESGYAGYADIAYVGDGRIALFYCYGARPHARTGELTPYKPEGLALQIMELKP